MTPRVKYGLIVGGGGLLINLVVSTLVGVCGPLTTLAAGALAGWLAARAEARPIRSDSAKSGAMSGAIAGSLMLIGQLIGGLIAISLIQSSGTQPLIGHLPQNGAEQVVYWIAGAGVGLCFGVLGIALGAGAGAAASYLSWREPTPSVGMPMTSDYSLHSSSDNR
jgi:hypothetical protein